MKISRFTLILPLMLSATVQAKSAPSAEEAATTAKVLDYVHARLDKFPKVELRTDLGEFIIDQEPEAIQAAVASIVKTVIQRAYSGETPGIAKGDHGKSQACLVGTMKVMDADSIPFHLQKGVIVPGATYKVETRLSNAEHPGASDASSTSQGVALRLKNISSVVGRKARLSDFADADDQDFLMTSATTFFLSNIVEYNKAFQIRSEGGIRNLFNFIVSNPWDAINRLGVETIAKLRAANILSAGKPKNILTHPYWSKHPYAWGEQSELATAVKYSVAPCENSAVLTKDSDQEEYQKKFIEDAFKKNQEICFYFRVQSRPPRATEEAYPIEDANIEWKENKAPFINVAKVTFKASENQNWNTPAAQTACGKTEFTPWNGLQAHQPLSNLARGRRYVYKASAFVRDSQKDLGLNVPTNGSVH